MNDIILNIRNLTKSFGDRTIIDDISLELRRAENLVLLGKSGTGKSVIMKCIVRLLEPDSGSIEVFGTDILNCNNRELAALRSEIGYLFQEGALYDSMTVRENLLFPALRNPKTRKLRKKELNTLAEKNLENVGLAEAADKMPSELSGGMKKRAGLARTLMLSPKFIIYDEPTTGLDPFTGEAISRLIVKIREDYQTASIIITHDIRCAEITADRMMVIDKGKLIAEGKFDEMKEIDREEVKLFFN